MTSVRFVLTRKLMRCLRLAPLAVVLPVLAGCEGDSGSAPPPVVAPTPVPTPTPTPVPTPTPTPTARPASVERAISPNIVDPVLSANEPTYIAINPDAAVAPKERLFVMLPGTGGIPRQVREISRTAGPRGYHAIALAYPNDTTVSDLCAGSTDVNCTGNIRREIITGVDVSPVVTINTANSIVGRLLKLISYLDRTYPAEGWGRFVSNGTIDWSLVTVAGHSQGSGHAAYMGKLYSLDRIVMFSGPSDIGVGNGTSAAWLSLPNVTPVARQYGFTHVADELVPFALVRNNWGLIGLASPGAPVSVDTATPPYSDSHQLSTNAPPDPSPIAGITYLNHLSTVIDVITPHNAQGVAIYTPVWVHLAFP
jgi:hypothetical protein